MKSYLSPNVQRLLTINVDEEFSSHDDVIDPNTWRISNTFKDIGMFSRICDEFLTESRIRDANLDWLLYGSTWKTMVTKKEGYDIIEAVLLMTCDLERSLGNVLRSRDRPVPNLLRDLLTDSELISVIGHTRVDILRSLMGCPQTLNLRNLVWHGFVGPGEIHPFLLSSIFVIGASIGWTLSTLTLSKSFSPDWERIRQIPSSLDTEFGDLIQLFGIERKDAVSRIMERLNSEEYGLCLANLLPLIEHRLRLDFATVNSYPERIMTAESSVMYTTLEEIFAQYLPDGVENKMKDYLGTNLMEFYYDIFVLPDGPRVRDRLCHGEYELFSNTNKVDYRKAILLLLTSISNPKRFRKYRPIFHPFSTFFDSVNSCLYGIEKTRRRLKSLNFDREEEDEETLRRIEDKYAVLPENSSVFSTLYRPQWEYELIGLLIRIVNTIKESNDKIVDNLETTNRKIENRELRSRRRMTAERMFDTLPFVFRVQFVTISYLITIFVHRDPTTIKSLKKVLKVFQNLLSRVPINRWNEIRIDLVQLLSLL